MYTFGDEVMYNGEKHIVTDKFFDDGRNCYELDNQQIVYEDELDEHKRGNHGRGRKKRTESK